MRPLVAVPVALALCLAACSSSPARPEAARPVDDPRPSSTTRDLPLAPPEVFELTEEKVSGDRYRITGDATRIRVVSPDANRGINARLALIDPATAASVDQAACVTWNGPYDTIMQPGVVLRLQVDAGVTRAIMVTQNVWAKARQTLNVHVVDSSAPNPLKAVGRVRVAAGIGDFWTPIPPPWRFCARVIAGEVQVTAWAPASFGSEPRWDDPELTGSVSLPPTASSRGRPGAYIGHLHPGESTELFDLDTVDLD